MKKSFFLLFLFGFLVQFADAQKSDLIVKTSEKGLFLEHKIAPKESFYSIGRLYTVHPKYIAAYNKLDMNKGLAIGQVVRIPLTDTNFTQKGNTGTPVYYRIGEKESLSKISSLHKNVSLDNLRGWNGLTDNTVGAGNQLVVGFLLSKEMPAVTLTPKEPVKQPKQAAVIEAKKEEAVTIAPTPAAEKPVEKKEEAKVEPKRTEPVFTKQETKPGSSENGFFKHYFDQQVRQTPIKKTRR